MIPDEMHCAAMTAFEESLKDDDARGVSRHYGSAVQAALEAAFRYRAEEAKSAAYKAVCPGCGERTLYFCTDDDGNASLSCGKNCNIILLPHVQTEHSRYTEEPIP